MPLLDQLLARRSARPLLAAPGADAGGSPGSPGLVSSHESAAVAGAHDNSGMSGTSSDGGGHGRSLCVLMVTSEWPTPEFPHTSPFLVQQIRFLRRAGVEVDVFFFRGARKPLNYFRAWRSLREHLARKQYDLVHAQYGQAGLIVWPVRLPVVVTFHGCDILGDQDPEGRITPGGRLLQQLCRLEALRADGVIIVSNEMRRYLPSSVRPLLLPTGVDFESLPTDSPENARRKFGLPETDRLVLFVGDPATVRKRYDLAERSVGILNERLPARLVLGWNKTHQEILTLMRACDVLVMTSGQEGSPTTVKEALATGLPVVSVPVGDVAERIGGVPGCELCTDDRPETIAAALERVLRHRQRLAEGDDLADLDERLLAERLIKLYRSVLKPAETHT